MPTTHVSPPSSVKQSLFIQTLTPHPLGLIMFAPLFKPIHTTHMRNTHCTVHCTTCYTLHNKLGFLHTFTLCLIMFAPLFKPIHTCVTHTVHYTVPRVTLYITNLDFLRKFTLCLIMFPPFSNLYTHA